MRPFLLLLFCAAGLSTAQPLPFTFAWLSDTHIGSIPGAEDLRASVRDINRIDSIAFVILSGDITEMGWNAEFELAKSILDSLTKPYYIVPGNHDTKWSESGNTKFSHVFGADRFVFDYGGFKFFGVHQGPIMRMGDGHFAPEDLRWVDSVLTNLEDDEQPLFFVTHYPLDSQIDNWYEMTQRLKRRNTQAVLCGHGHRNKVLEFEGIPGIMGRSNLHTVREPGGYNIVSLRSDSMFFFERTPGIATKLGWHGIPLGKRDYSDDTTTYLRPDFTINSKYPAVQPAWKIETGFTIASAPTVWGDHVIVGNGGGILACYSAESGDKHWEFAAGGSVYSTPATENLKVVFGSSDGYVYCLDIDDGNLIWKYKTGGAVVACPTISKSVVYIGSSDGKFRALNLSNGRLRWQFSGVGAFVETKPLVYRNKVVFGAWDSFLYGLNIEDGSLSWKWSNGNAGRGFSPAACWPVASEGRVFIVAPDRAMTSIDISTGQELWRTKAHQVREAIGISEDGSRVYAKGMNDTLFAFSSTSATAQLVWATHCSYGYDIDPSMPMEKDGTVFFGHKNGTVFALDAKTGVIRWQHKIGNTIINTVAPIDSNRVVVTDFDGRIVLIENKPEE